MNLIKKWAFLPLFTLLFASSAIHAVTAHRAPSSTLQNGDAVYELADPKAYSAIYVVSDVHGMSAEIRKALGAAKVIDSSAHWIAGNSLLLILGDSIDKGPDTIGVIDFWRALAPQAADAGGGVVHLLGNHEAELLADPSSNLTKVLSQELQSKNLSVNDLIDPSTPRGAFMHSEAIAGRVGNWFFCHAGLYPSMTWADFKAKASQELSSGSYGDPFVLGSDSVLEAKNWWKKQSARDALLSQLNQNGMTGVVQGHQPAAYNILNRVGATQGGHFVRIDCGASPPAGSNPIQILKFPNPEELTTHQVPEMIVISDDGSSAPIEVTELVGDVKKSKDPENN